MPDQQANSREVPINRWPENRTALAWLRRAGAWANPEQPYVIQLAKWGVEEAGLSTLEPLRVGQPTPQGVKQTMCQLLGTGAEPALKAMWRLHSNPNLDRAEQQATLNRDLDLADTPEQAAMVVLETIRALMAATSG